MQKALGRDSKGLAPALGEEAGGVAVQRLGAFGVAKGVGELKAALADEAFGVKREVTARAEADVIVVQAPVQGADIGLAVEQVGGEGLGLMQAVLCGIGTIKAQVLQGLEALGEGREVGETWHVSVQGGGDLDQLYGGLFVLPVSGEIA